MPSMLIMPTPWLVAQTPPLETRLVERAGNTTTLITESFDGLWEGVLNGPLYASITNIAALLAVLSLGVFLVQWAAKMMEGNSNTALNDLIWPIIVIALLANNGAMFANLTLDARTIANQTISTMMEETVLGANLAADYNENRILDAANKLYTEHLETCLERRNGVRQSEDRCRRTAMVARRDFLRAQEKATAANADEFDLGWFGSIVELILSAILYVMHMAYGWLLEIVMLLTALIGPLAVGLSLLPTPSKPLFAWMGGFFSTVLAKLTFNIISGLASYVALRSNVGAINALLLPMLLGLFSPILSTFIGLQGGQALTNALASVATYKGYGGALFLTKRFVRGASRAVPGRR